MDTPFGGHKGGAPNVWGDDLSWQSNYSSAQRGPEPATEKKPAYQLRQENAPDAGMPFADIYSVHSINPPTTRQPQENTIPEPPQPEASSSQTDRWVTVFGFTRAESAMVLAEFRKVGELTDRKFGSGEANWMHLQFKDKYSAQRALLKNATTLPGSSTMLGVVRCSDNSIAALGGKTQVPDLYQDPRVQKQLQERVNIEFSVTPGVGPQPVSPWRSFCEYVLGI